MEEKYQETKSNYLLDKYKLIDKDDNETASNWKKILVHDDETNPSNTDWYSTKTFQAFLDALDIDQPSTLHGNLDKKNNIPRKSADKISSTNISLSATELDKTIESPARSNIEIKLSNDNNNMSHQELGFVKPERNFGEETILSAEALKILSELPDLSHMSGTRSFIFPNSNNKKSDNR